MPIVVIVRIQQVSINNETVGKPIAHVSSQMQVTGEATYADDTPQYKGKYHQKFNKWLIDQLLNHMQIFHVFGITRMLFNFCAVSPSLTDLAFTRNCQVENI